MRAAASSSPKVSFGVGKRWRRIPKLHILIDAAGACAYDVPFLCNDVLPNPAPRNPSIALELNRDEFDAIKLAE